MKLFILINIMLIESETKAYMLLIYDNIKLNTFKFSLKNMKGYSKMFDP